MKNNQFKAIQQVSGFVVVGCSMEMSLNDFKASSVWQLFMQRRSEVPNEDFSCYYDVNSYNKNYFDDYNPYQLFTKLAGVKCSNVVDGFNSIVIPDGRYAIFVHEGSPSDISKTFQYIFSEWLPQNNEQVDHRPHFMKLPIDYNRDTQTVKEEIYIPLK